MTETVAKAKIEDIQELAEKIGTPCNLFPGERNACEAETMIGQTLHACIVTHKKYGEAFSWRGAGVFTSGHGGLVNNGTAYGMLLERGYFLEEERGDRTIIIMTQKLVDLLKGYLAR